MILNIKPIHDDSCDCTEDLIISIAHWLNMDYEIIFADSWGFEFKPAENSQKVIGEMIKPGKNLWGLTEDSLGIKLINVKVNDFNDLLHELNIELSNGRPVIITIDSYWNPSDFNYQKNHFYYHTILAIGYDSINDNIIYIDPFTAPDSILNLPINNLKEGLGPSLKKLKFVNKTIKKFDWSGILNDLILKLEGRKSCETPFNVSMKSFADYIKKYFDFSIESAGYNHPPHWPICMAIERIYKGRKQFLIFLKYCFEKYNLPGFIHLFEGLEKVSLEWSMIRMLLIKGTMVENANALIKRIATKVNELAIFEEDLYFDLKKLLEIHNNGGQNEWR